MEFPFFDGYNMSVDEFIEIIENEAKGVSPLFMQDFITDILNSLRGEARNIAFRYSYKHYVDIENLLYDHFSQQPSCEEIFRNDLGDSLPLYDGYNLPFQDFAYEVTQTASRVPNQFYEIFLDVLLGKLVGKAREFIGYINGFKNHLDVLDELGWFFNGNHARNLSRNYQYEDYHEDENIVADIGPPYQHSTAKIKGISNDRSVGDTLSPLSYSEEQNITELKEICEPLTLTSLNPVTVGVIEVSSGFNTPVIVERGVTECPLIVTNASGFGLERLAMPFQVQNPRSINLGHIILQLNTYDTMESPISYEATILTKPEIHLETNLANHTINFHKVRAHPIPILTNNENRGRVVTNTTTDILIAISPEQPLASFLEIQEPIPDFPVAVEKITWTTNETPVKENFGTRNTPDIQIPEGHHHSYIIPHRACVDELLPRHSKHFIYSPKRISSNAPNGTRRQYPNFKYRKKWYYNITCSGEIYHTPSSDVEPRRLFCQIPWPKGSPKGAREQIEEEFFRHSAQFGTLEYTNTINDRSHALPWTSLGLIQRNMTTGTIWPRSLYLPITPVFTPALSPHHLS